LHFGGPLSNDFQLALLVWSLLDELDKLAASSASKSAAKSM
jgi:hypothetical protein